MLVDTIIDYLRKYDFDEVIADDLGIILVTWHGVKWCILSNTPLYRVKEDVDIFIQSVKDKGL